MFFHLLWILSQSTYVGCYQREKREKEKNVWIQELQIYINYVVGKQLFVPFIIIGDIYLMFCQTTSFAVFFYFYNLLESKI